jgi:DNA primase large subunit
MQRLHARYPFLDTAREAVQDAAVDLAELVARSDSPVVDRAEERVRTALLEGTVGDLHRTPRVELLSYPVARVIVSLVDERALTRAYARAEAETAFRRFSQELAGGSDLKSVGGDPLTLDRLLAEFDLSRAVDVVEAGAAYRVAVGPYLELSAGVDGDAWALVERELADGRVPVDGEELLTLLRGAVEDRVAGGLPLSVPKPIAEGLTDEVAAVRDALADLHVRTDLDVVAPELFPASVTRLVERLRDGEHLADHERFALAAFLAATGCTPAEATALCEVADTDEGDLLARQVAAVRDGDAPGMYAPPSFETMDAYGILADEDAASDEFAHPLSYYEAMLDRADEVADWRERADVGG